MDEQRRPGRARTTVTSTAGRSLFLPLPSSTELARRAPRLLGGVVVMGFGIALMVLSGLGLGPWDVLHQGLSTRTGVPIGTVGILVGVLVLLAWVPLRQRLGIGTVVNTVLVGATIDVVLAVAPDVGPTWLRWVALVVGICCYAGGSGLYIGAGLSPGPRDGLMTGLAERGASIRVVRTGLELAVLVAGWALGGTIGVGTVLPAVTVGPLIQLVLERTALAPLLPATPVPDHPHPPV